LLRRFPIPFQGFHPVRPISALPIVGLREPVLRLPITPDGVQQKLIGGGRRVRCGSCLGHQRLGARLRWLLSWRLRRWRRWCRRRRCRLQRLGRLRL